jgi:hypothetical protein
MLNFFFPFLSPAAQPTPAAEAAPAPEGNEDLEAASPEHGRDLASPAPVPSPKAPRRKSSGSKATQARMAAGQSDPKKVVAGQRQSTRKPKGAETRSTRPNPASQGPEVEKSTQRPMLVEVVEPPPKTVEQGVRPRKWGPNAQRRGASASSLPAGQRWKRRLPRASW